MQNINPERGRLWTQALLSDEYQQARGAFIERDEDGVIRHCCLAVATDVAIKNGLDDVRWDLTEGKDPALLFAYDEGTYGDYRDYDYREVDGDIWIEHTDGDLPKPVANWFGMEGGTREDNESSTDNPMLDGVTAIARNDDGKESFQQIADAVEAEIAKVEARS